MKPTLATERLVLRPTRMDDAARLFELDADPEVRRYVDQPDAPTLAQCETLAGRFLAIDAATPEHGFWIAEERGVFAGWFQLRPPRDGEPAEPGDMEIGYRLMRAAWGRGLATEGSRALIDYGFGVLRAPRVIAVALEANVASTRVMEKLGMSVWRRWEHRSRASGALIPAVTYARQR